MSTLCPFCGETMKVDRSGGLTHSYKPHGENTCYMNGTSIGSERVSRFQRRHPGLWVADDGGRPRFNADGEGMAATAALCNDIINYLKPKEPTP